MYNGYYSLSQTNPINTCAKGGDEGMEFQVKGREHQELNLPVQPSNESLSSAELPQGQVKSECPECKLLLRYPQRVTCCQRRFCGECIEKLLKDGKPCPSCNEADFSTLPDDSDECLGLKSTNKDEGVGELASDLEEHANSKPSPETQLDGCPQDHPPVQASKPPHPSGYDSGFVGEHRKHQLYRCPVCLQVLRDPQQFTCCGNSYCKVCIDRVVKDGTPCPTCNVAFSTFPDSSLPSREDQHPEDPPVQPARPDPPVQSSRPPRPSSRARPCGYDCEFVERPPPQVQYECPVCLQVLRDPQQTTCCGNSFCKVCIDRVVKDGIPCPTCNAVAFSIFPNKGLRRTLGGFRVYCSNKDEGCEWVGELGDIERHLNSKPSPERQLEGCLFEEVACVYCTCLFQRRYIHEHQSNKCPKRQFQCEYCGEIDSYEIITEIHLQKCPSFPIACHQHCGENVQRQEMDYHVSQDCSMTIVDCDYQEFGCEVRPARKDLSTHITESVADHTAMLAKSLCKEEKAKAQFMRKVEEDAKAQAGLSADNTKILKLQEKNLAELHRKFSEQQESINNLQNENQKLKRCIAEDITVMKRQHFQHLCYILTIALAIAAVGIGLASYHGDTNLDSKINDTRSEVKDLIMKLEDKLHDVEEDLNTKLEDKLHDVEEDLNTKLEDKDSYIRDSFKSERKKTADSLAQVHREVTTEKSEREKTAESLAQVKREVATEKSEREKTAESLAQVKREVATEKSEREKTAESLAQVKREVATEKSEREKTAESLAEVIQLQSEMGRRVLKMTDFEKNKSADAQWFSPPFYTHTHGYKMCIRVIANGYRIGKGTHVSVSLYLMPGMFDDDLEWPFRGHITIELINQLNRKSNHMREINFSHISDLDIVSKVTSGDRAAKGRAWYNFIAHSKLDYNADEQTQYLKDDSLIFRITKVTNVK